MPANPLEIVQQSQAALDRFTGVESPPLPTAADKEPVQAALLALAKLTDYQMFGILAASCDQGIAALRAYAQAFGYEMPSSWQPVEGPTYIKFNPNLGSCHTDSYTGEHRGVLVSYQSAADENLNQIYGHFPLDLF